MEQRGGAGFDLGPELVTNGTFDSDITGWSAVNDAGASSTVVSGEVVLTTVSAGTAARLRKTVAVTAGTAYVVAIKYVSLANVGSPGLQIWGGGYGSGALATTPASSAAGTFYYSVVATGASLYLQLQAYSTSGAVTAILDNVSVKKLLTGTGETWSITNTAVADPAGVRWGDGEAYLRTIAVAGNFASTPDSAANSITGDSTWIFSIAPESWNSGASQYISGKYGSAGNRSWGIYLDSTLGRMVLTTSANGTDAIARTNAIGLATLFTANQNVYFKVVLDVDNGESGNDYNLSYSLDYNPVAKTGTWTPIGTKVTTAGTTSIFDSASSVVLGTVYSGITTNLVGKIRYFAQWANLTGAGTPAYEFYPQRDCVRPKSAALDFDNSNDYLMTPIAPASDGYFCCAARLDSDLTTIDNVFGAYKTTATIQAGVGMRVNATTGTVAIQRAASDGSSAIATTSTAISIGVPFIADCGWGASQSEVRLNGAGEGTSSLAKDPANADTVFTIGGSNTGTAAAPTISAPLGGAIFLAGYTPTIPTTEQKATIRKLMAQIAGVSGVV